MRPTSQKLAALGGTADKAPFVSSVEDFYFTNPIARASAVMAECSALAPGARDHDGGGVGHDDGRVLAPITSGRW